MTCSSSEKKGSEENGDKDPFGDIMDDNDDILAMAKKFEDRYGPKPSKKKKRQQHWEDYVDKGLGYDETDPFIDNDEAYDELVPSSITTQYGGFYINLGELEFRAVSSDSEPFPYDPTRKHKKKKKIKDLFEKAKRKKRAIIIEDDEIVPVKKKGKKLLDASSNKVENTLQIEAKKKVKATVVDTKEDNSPVTAVNNNHPTSISGNCISQNSNDSDFETAKDTSFIASCLSDMEGDGEETEQKNPTDQPQDIPKLPLNMPSDLDACVNKLKQAASTSAEGKCKFFSNEVNDMLLNVELKSRQLSKSHRSMIYSHLASHLPCTKETLQKRAKKLTLDREDGKLRKPVEKLREAIASVMLAQIEKYDAECEAVTAEIAAEKSETTKETKGENEEEDKKSRLPRRKFAWTNDIRSLLCEVVSVKLKCFEVMKVRTQTVEEFLRQFFDMEVRDIWPNGWINARILLRESKSVYNHLSKAKKPSIVPRKIVQGVIPSINIPSTVPNSISSVGPAKTENSQAPTTVSLTSIKSTSLSQISETAALPSISKLIQQTKVSSFPAVSTASSVGANVLIKNSENVNGVPKTESATTLSLNVLPPNLKSSPESKPSSISIKPVSLKVETEKTFEASQVKQLPKNNMFISEPTKQPSFNKPIKTKPDLAKPSIDIIMSAGAKPLSSKTIKPSLMSVITSTSMASLHKEQLISKESTAYDVLDQIINASLGNFSSDKTNNDLFSSSGPSKLVDNALMDLINSQPKESTVINQTQNPSRTLSSESLPNITAQLRPTPAVSIVKTSPQQTLPISGKLHSRSTNIAASNLENFMPTIQNANDNLMKSYEKFLTENPLPQAISVTPVQNVVKNRSNVSSSSMSSGSSIPVKSSSVVDPAASLRSSYGFHEAFLNSLSGNPRELPESQNVVRFAKSTNNKNIDYKDMSSNSQPSSSVLKKQDFYSHNRPINYSHPTEDISMTGNAYSSSTFSSRTSPQSAEKMKNNVRHHNTTPKQTMSEAVYTSSAESVANFVNLAVDKPKKPPSTNVPQFGNNKNFIQSANDFSQDRLVSGLLHHASFTNEKLSSSNFNVPKPSMKSDNFTVEKHQPQSTLNERELCRSSLTTISHPSIYHSHHKRSEDLVSHSPSTIANKPVLLNTCNTDQSSSAFKLPSPQTTSHQNFHPLPKSPSLQVNQTSPSSFNKFGASHLTKSYSHSQHQPVSVLQNPIMLPVPGGRLYQTSPTSSASHLHSVASPLIPANSPVYSHIPNVFGNQTSPQVTSPQHSIITTPVLSSPYNPQNISGLSHETYTKI
ncbi:Ubinuclein-2 [Nymphon striatum]|nr:Ubinuclein-2 [Nymphon striatum]